MVIFFLTKGETDDKLLISAEGWVGKQTGHSSLARIPFGGEGAGSLESEVGGMGKDAP